MKKKNYLHANEKKNILWTLKRIVSSQLASQIFTQLNTEVSGITVLVIGFPINLLTLICILP